jgi:nucleoporin GLE1
VYDLVENCHGTSLIDGDRFDYMASSSPLRRRSYQFSTVKRSSLVLPDYLSESKNSPERHRQLLEAADQEHQRIITRAERIFSEVQRIENERRLQDEQRHIAEQKARAEEIRRLEQQNAKEREQLERMRALSVSPTSSPAPAAETPITPGAVEGSAHQTTGFFSAKPVNGVKAQQPPRSSPLAHSVERSQPPNSTTTPTQKSLSPIPSPQKTQQQAAPTQVSSASTGPPKLPEPPRVPAVQVAPVTQDTSASRHSQDLDRYQTIHQNLKALRKDLVEQARSNPGLKARMGDMRREVRKSVGQLTGEKGANVTQVGTVATRPSRSLLIAYQTQKVSALLRESLSGSIPSRLIDPNNFVLRPRQPVEGAARNEAQLPSLFFYLLNIFTKAAVLQWRNEGSAKPETAGPVGVVVVGMFAEPDLMWRGESLIDVLIAKFRVVCPVLFGARGSEKSDAGRKALGWKKDGGLWVSEQQHYDSMAGLGIGFASIALRSFAKTKKKNPYPPTHYWTAMAHILNTPSHEISDSQCVVLKAIIAHGESKFITFYGNAAVQALTLALVDFPARAPEKTASVKALSVHAQIVRQDLGLLLA